MVVLVVFLPFSGGYFFSYLYRTINSVLGKTLIVEMGLSAGDIGLMTAAYLLAFAAAQIPLGVALDRFGPRRVNASLLTIAAAGAVVFSFGTDRDTLMVGRAMIGFGVSAALMASFKAITQWFPKTRWPLINGCLLAFGGFGAMAGTAPVEFALGFTDWRGIFQGLAAGTAVIALVIFFVVPEHPAKGPPQRLANQIRGLKTVYGSRIFWALGPIAVSSLAANLAIQGLWAGLWLRDVAALTPNHTASVLLILNVGMTAGFIGIGAIADFLQRRGVSLAAVMTAAVTVFILVQAAIVAEVDVTGVWLWALFGFLANSSILTYPIIAGHFPIEYAGRANTAINFISFIGAFAAQYAVGGIIDLFPSGPGGTYIPAAYRAAFGTLLALQIAGFLWYLYAFRRVGRDA
jgi:sugar phosphate permease